MLHFKRLCRIVYFNQINWRKEHYSLNIDSIKVWGNISMLQRKEELEYIRWFWNVTRNSKPDGNKFSFKHWSFWHTFSLVVLCFPGDKIHFRVWLCNSIWAVEFAFASSLSCLIETAQIPPFTFTAQTKWSMYFLFFHWFIILKARRCKFTSTSSCEYNRIFNVLK